MDGKFVARLRSLIGIPIFVTNGANEEKWLNTYVCPILIQYVFAPTNRYLITCLKARYYKIIQFNLKMLILI